MSELDVQESKWSAMLLTPVPKGSQGKYHARGDLLLAKVADELQPGTLDFAGFVANFHKVAESNPELGTPDMAGRELLAQEYERRAERLNPGPAGAPVNVGVAPKLRATARWLRDESLQPSKALALAASYANEYKKAQGPQERRKLALKAERKGHDLEAISEALRKFPKTYELLADEFLTVGLLTSDD